MNKQRLVVLLDALDSIRGVLAIEINRMTEENPTKEEFEKEEVDCPEIEDSCEYCNNDACPYYKGE